MTLYEDLGSNAIDILDGKVDVEVSGDVLTSKLGDYVISYTAVDLSGNEAKMLERQVSVVDKTAPEIRIAGLSTVIHEAGTAYSDEGATATDLGSSVNVTTSGTVDASTVGSYTITYSAAAVSYTHLTLPTKRIV